MSQPIRSREGVFAAGVAGLVVLVTLVGFARSFFLLPFFDGPPSWAAREPIFYAHGAIFAAWYALIAVQVTLVRSRNLRLHRRLGWAGAGLAALVVAAGVLAALRAANRPGGFIGVPFPPDQFLAVPLFGVALFAVLVGLAVLWRRNAARHKRLMLMASISLLGAPVARIVSMTGAPPFLDLIVYAALIACVVAWDLATERRLRPDTALAGAAVLGVNAAALPIGATAAWLALAHPLMSLVPPP